jgi:xyloglucan-specific exo-beta-1,4-glucanase
MVKAQSFGNVTMGGGGYVTGVITCPSRQNLIYARTDVGGAYRWDEPTQSWIPLLDWNSQNQTSYQGVESMAIDPSAPNKLYILAGTAYWNSGITAILCSTNYGTNFTITDVTSKFKANGNGADRNKGESLAVDPNLGSILFCGSRANGLFKSTDSGATWNAVSSLNVGSASISFVEFDPASGTAGTATPRIFVGVFTTGTNLLVSNDAGGTWTALTNSPSASLPQRCALASDRNLYIAYGNDTHGAIMRYNLTNGVWANCSPSGARTYGGISVSASDPKKLVASTYNNWLQQPNGSWGDRFFASTDSGATWNDLIANSKFAMSPNGFPYIAPAAIHWAGTIEMDPFNSDRVFVGSGNGIFCTTNLNSGLTLSTWKFTVKGLEETVPLDFISVPGGPFLSSVGDQGGFIHTDITVSPAMGNMSQSASFACAAGKTKFIARVVNNGELYYSQQLPVTWTKMPSTPGVMTNGEVAISADGARVLWKSTVGSAQTTYVTTNLGTNWTLSTGLTFNCNPIADPVNASKFYAYNSSDGYMYVSTDGGLTFNKSGSVGTGGSATFCAAPGFEGHVWVARGGSGLRYSTNSGATFYSGNANTCDAITFGKTMPGASYPTLFIWGKPASGSVAGLYRSTDQGLNWVRVNDDAHQYGGRGNAGLIEGDKNVHGRVYMSTAGRGVVYMDSTVPVTGVSLTPATSSAFVTGTQQLIASVSPVYATYPAVTWASSNAAIATVSSSGLVTANAPGITTITVTTFDGGFVAGTTVTVTNLMSSPRLIFSQNNSSAMVLSWPADHRGWRLQTQTNSLSTGLGTNWVTVPGSASLISLTNAINAANDTVFYRLADPN